MPSFLFFDSLLFSSGFVWISSGSVTTVWRESLRPLHRPLLADKYIGFNRAKKHQGYVDMYSSRARYSISISYP